MGISPVDLEEMSLWQFSCAIDGWNAAQKPDQPPAMSNDDFDGMIARRGKSMGMA